MKRPVRIIQIDFSVKLCVTCIIVPDRRSYTNALKFHEFRKWPLEYLIKILVTRYDKSQVGVKSDVI
jgi:hypothetical protein